MSLSRIRYIELHSYLDTLPLYKGTRFVHLSFHLNFSNDDDNYGYATILFIVVPFVLTLTIGQGYLELHEAATMEKFKQRLWERISFYSDDHINELVEKLTPGLGKRVFFDKA